MPDSPVVICVGLVKGRGVELARDAFVKWKNLTKSDATLLFVGQVKDSDLAVELERSHAVKCIGRVDRLKTLQLMSRAQILICCSESRGHTPSVPRGNCD